MIPDGLVRGDLIQVEWVDITEDPVGNPDAPVLARRHSIGYFWARSEVNDLPVLVTTTTLETDVDVQTSGYCTYPEGVVSGIKVIKRKRRPRKIEVQGK